MLIRCPTCSKQKEVKGLADLPSFPFCSDRCKLVDLGRWIDEAHAIPAKPALDEPDSEPASEGDDDE